MDGPSPAEVFDLRRLDLNLVVPLHAVLVERSVSAAARRVGLTQPAVSKSLQRLRQHFGDDLLVRAGRTSVLTPFAATLLPEVEELVRRLGDVLTQRDDFDPAQTRRRFTLAASDYFVVTRGGDLVQALLAGAPLASLEIVDLAGPPVHDQLGSVDAMLLPAGQDDHLPSTGHLLTERWTLVCDPSMAEDARGWTVDDLAGRGFVATSFHGFVPGQRLLSNLGVTMDVRVTAQTFAAVPFLVAGTELLGLVGGRLARRLAGAAGVAVLEAPWSVPLLPYQLHCDPVRRNDPGVRWFLEVVEAVARG
ncbi:LysR family transcriptional regulator [Nocardioides sp. J2M5]|uniref:LysR family transcriptional regulator n=1 Tax=Nocardioides palaemonis TaxID=2829810 RepID=UPI001BA84E20|nr:LysR family transcriptional regulator [Nocardioides palaemonis]MBS2939800.1 LysR family transcriptional regulator [Nocardioides palaemonis]